MAWVACHQAQLGDRGHAAAEMVGALLQPLRAEGEVEKGFDLGGVAGCFEGQVEHRCTLRLVMTGRFPARGAWLPS